MSNVLIAYDGSGSTGGAVFYHDQTQRIVAEFPDAQILFWDSSHRVITHHHLRAINAARKGAGGTSSEEIAKYIQSKNFHGRLVIITDGEVSPQSVDRCANYVSTDWRFESVTAHLIGHRHSVNMSVTCPFTRNSPHTIYTYYSDSAYERQQATLVTQSDLDSLQLIKKIKTIEEFIAAADAIERTVIARTMGTMGDPSLRDEILAMKKRAIAAEARVLGASDAVTSLEAALGTGDTRAALVAARTITAEYYDAIDAVNVDGGSWSARLNRLVSMCEGALRSTFDLSNLGAAIKSDRVRRAALATAAPTAAAPLTESSTADASVAPTFTCPITWDDERDIVLLTVSEGSSVLAGLDKDVVNNLIDCPLNALNYPDVVERIKGKLDHPVSLRAYRASALSDNPIEVSPFTRATVHGGLTLAPNAEHAAATNWTLARVIAGGKLVGNADLWYAVVWLLVANGHIPYLAPIEPQLREHMIYRLRNHTTFIALTGLPELPTTRVKLATAIWYVFAASALDLPPRREPLRAHVFHAAPLERLRELTGYALPPGCDEHYARLRALMTMLSWVKRDRFALPEAVIALTQAAIEIDPSSVGQAVCDRESRVPRWIPIDGKATDAQRAAVRATLPPACRDLSIPEITSLAALVDPSKSLGDIELPFYGAPPVAIASIVGWRLYGLEPVPSSPVRICAATCRPYYQVTPLATWKDASMSLYGDVSQQHSTNEQYGRFVQKYTAYPTRDEFLVYLYNRDIAHGAHKTLPAAILQFVDETFAENAAFTASITPAEYVRRWRASVTIDQRKLLEAQEIVA
jgi:hypothetical protein